MADNFNMKQFLAENKLGAYSKLKENEEQLNEYEVTYEYGSDGSCYRVDDEGNYDEVDDSYCRRYAGQGVREDMGKDIEDTEAAKQMDFLAEYEVIYVVQNGRCYRKDDEGNMDEVNMSYCRRYSEGKEEVEESSLNEAGLLSDPNFIAGLSTLLGVGTTFAVALAKDLKNAKTPEEKKQILQSLSKNIDTKFGGNMEEGKEELKEFDEPIMQLINDPETLKTFLASVAKLGSIGFGIAGLIKAYTKYIASKLKKDPKFADKSGEELEKMAGQALTGKVQASAGGTGGGFLA